MNTLRLILCILILFVTSLLISIPQVALAQLALLPVASPLSDDATIFSPPLGYHNGIKYGPRYTYDNGGALIENTDYGVTNPDLSHYSDCFAIEMRYLIHAGEDWYRPDRSPANSDEVTAVADGIVYDYDTRWSYPGYAVILQHTLPSGNVYSVYMHIENVPSGISNGQPVYRGQKLGTILQQNYDGRYPQYHGTDDSHLHFEMRYFASANGIYSDHPLCNKGDAAGRGYTYPGYPPDTYPNSSQHYTDPTTFVQSHSGSFLPLIMVPPCNQGSTLIMNGNFEQGRVYWIDTGNIILNNVRRHGGSWSAWFGGYNSAYDVMYQVFNVPRGATSVSLTYYVWIETNETSPNAYDYLRVQLRNETGSLLSTIDMLSNASTKGTWLTRPFNINTSQYLGQYLRLSFEATTDATMFTSFYIDDVSLTLNCSGANSLPQEGTESETVATQQVESSNPVTLPRKPTATPATPHPYP